MIEEEEIELTDRIGNFLKPGDIVAYSTTSRSQLNIGVFVEARKKEVGQHGMTVTPVVRIVRGDGQVRNQTLKRIWIYRGREFNGRIENMVVVHLPEFKLDILDICECLEVIDDMKDEGIISDE